MAENEATGYEFLASLTAAEETELPKRAGGATGKARIVQNNPFTPWVSESYADGKGRAVTVPNENVKKTEYLIRQAAEDLGLGVRIVFVVKGDVKDKKSLESVHKKSNVKVMFQGQKKRSYSARRKSAEATVAETGAGAPTE